MNNLDIIKPGALLWVSGTRSCMGRDTSDWSCPFKILSIEEINENNIKVRVFDYDEMKEIPWTFYKESVATNKRICEIIEVKKYLLQKKNLLSFKIQELKDKIEILDIDKEIIDKHILNLEK